MYRDGILSESVTDISTFWQDDHVAFAPGCSFTFENALMEAGIPIWHIQNNKTVPMYRSSIMKESAGIFGGEMVVTMRAVEAAPLVGRAVPVFWACGVTPQQALMRLVCRWQSRTSQATG